MAKWGQGSVRQSRSQPDAGATCRKHGGAVTANMSGMAEAENVAGSVEEAT